VPQFRGSDNDASIATTGRSQIGVTGIEVRVKHSARDGWAFYRFETSQEGTIYPKTAGCYSCHEQDAAVDTTFVHYYARLIELAKAKGNFKSTQH
jgi:hypothetical protein